MVKPKTRVQTKGGASGDASPVVEELRRRLAEAEETLGAIRSGQVDAVVVSSPQGEKIFVLKSQEQPYRVFVETMHEGAVSLLANGLIAYSNQRFAGIVKTPLERVIGTRLEEFVPPDAQDRLRLLLAQGLVDSCRDEFLMQAGDGTSVWVQLSLIPMALEDTTGICLIATDITERKEADRALRCRAEEMEEFNAAAVGRELRMIELKEEVNALARQLGHPQPYDMEGLHETVVSSGQEVEHDVTERATDQ